MNSTADVHTHSCYCPLSISFSFSFFVTIDERDDWIAHDISRPTICNIIRRSLIHNQTIDHCFIVWRNYIKASILTAFCHSTTTSNGDHKQRRINYGKQSCFFSRLDRTVLCANSNRFFFHLHVFSMDVELLFLFQM